MRAAVFLAALLLPLPALAHPGVHGAGGFASGLMHPFGGLDHVVAMVAVGLWASVLGGRAPLLLPLGFLVGMTAGGGLGMAGVAIPLVEPGILASMVVLGGLVAILARVPLVVAVAVGAGFGLLHGHAHGTEMVGSALGNAIGFLLATAALHGAGLLAGRVAGGVGSMLVPRLAGAVGAAAGIALMLA
ncbi:urease accessory protein [Falsiroseomonas bella]|uniref:Urease accessory protein n=1 Tax=Falsiroseomonas bella TaxID=2184016 RepID=A0A317F652_9PROT|nr:HupE/UreJ family protein [Falsiroseomonas bella]PWS34681.1 urease accessory protein [Falsiroseomonas bella]